MTYYVIPAAFIIALLLSLLFAALSPRLWRGIFLFFLIVFLAGWAGQLWVVPFGPIIMGIALLPLLFVALIFSLLIIAVSPPVPVAKDSSGSQIVVPDFTLGMFFWILIVVLTASIAFGYFR